MSGKVQNRPDHVPQDRRAQGNGNAPREKQKKHRPKRFYDYSLLFAVIFITALGLIMIYSSSQYTAALQYGGDSAYYFKRQAMIASAGLVMGIILSKFNYHWLRVLSKPIYIVAILLLLGTMVMGVASHGQTRWIRIAGVQFQPGAVEEVVTFDFGVFFLLTGGQRQAEQQGEGYVSHFFRLFRFAL